MFRGSIEILPESRPSDVLVMFCDFRGFTRQTSDRRLSPEAGSKVASHLYKHVVRFCSTIKPHGTPPPFFKPAGDGLLVVWELPKSDIKRILNMIISEIIHMHDEFSLPPDLVPVTIQARLGIGATRGAAACIKVRQGNSENSVFEDYFGYPVNLASKLQNLARPSGVVLDKRSLEVLGKDLLAKFDFDSRYVAGEGLIEILVYGESVSKQQIPLKKALTSRARASRRPGQIADMFHSSHGYVLGVRAKALHSAGVRPSKKLITDPKRIDQIIKIIVDPNNQEQVPREDFENDPSFLQIIPYPILRCRGKIFAYARGIGGKEQRLESEKSIGVGGHISAIDPVSCQKKFFSVPIHTKEILFHKVAIRGGAYRWIRAGIIWDNTTMTNSVHLGIIYILDLNSETDLKVLDKEVIVQPIWTPLFRLSPEGFESWSQICLNSGILAEEHRDI